MKSKLWIFSILIAFTLLWGCETPEEPGDNETDPLPPANAVVLYVSYSGSDDTGNGSYDKPFATIQKAVDEASDGDYILLQPRPVNDLYYIENVQVDTSVNIQTLNSGNEYINVKAADASKPVFHITAGKVTLNWLHIEGTDNATDFTGAIHIDNAEECTIRRCRVSNNTNGIMLEGALMASITSNEVSDNINGIYMLDCPLKYNNEANIISANDIRNNTGCGLRIENSSPDHITDGNTYSENDKDLCNY